MFVYGEFGSDQPHAYNQTTLGKNLRECRRRLNISQPIAAQMVGITRGVLSKIETGHCHTTLRTLAALAIAYDTTLEALFAGVRSEELL